jgi:hypothetical protein
MDHHSDFIAAVRLRSNPDGSSTFELGKLPTLKPMSSEVFWISTVTEDWEKNVHPAPRRQYVITLKGKIRFSVSDGSTFLIEPGIMLLAEDTEGEGHSWEIEEGTSWERLYIPMTDSDNDFFVSD